MVTHVYPLCTSCTIKIISVLPYDSNKKRTRCKEKKPRPEQTRTGGRNLQYTDCIIQIIGRPNYGVKLKRGGINYHLSESFFSRKGGCFAQVDSIHNNKICWVGVYTEKEISHRSCVPETFESRSADVIRFYNVAFPLLALVIKVCKSGAFFTN